MKKRNVGTKYKKVENKLSKFVLGQEKLVFFFLESSYRTPFYQNFYMFSSLSYIVVGTLEANRSFT